MNKKDGRKINRDVLEYLRIQAIKLWKKEKEVSEISESLGVTIFVVYKWIRTYKKKGYEGLKRRKALGANPKISKKEIKMLLKILNKTADYYGFETPLWDCKKIKQIIYEKLGKNIHYSNVWRLLIKLKLSCQVPEKEALEKNEREVKRWLREEWPKIQEHRRRWQAMLYFQDECGVSLIPVTGKTWAKKGETPKIKVTAKRGGFSLTSAISPAGRMVFRIEKEKVKSKEHIGFLKQIMKQHKWRKIIIIEDRARPHTSKETQKFLEENKNKIAVYHLPPYSPDINPQEQVWNYLKYAQLKAHQAKSKEEFKPLLLKNMRSIQRQKSLIKSFFYVNSLF